MDTSGTNFHRSNLLGTLAYFGSPAVALRSQANASSLDSTALYSRAVVPLSEGGLSSTLAPTDITTAATGPDSTNVVVGNTTTTETTAQHTGVTVENTTHTTTTPLATHQSVPTPVNVLSHAHLAGQGDPHWTVSNGGTEWTQQGIPGDTYLIASGNDVFVSALYGQNGGYNYCTMQEAQVVIAANPAAGIPSEVTINYGIYDQSSVQINGQAQQVDGLNQTFGNVQVQGNGDSLTITTTASNGSQGVFNIDSSWGLGLEITAQGTFDNANGLMQYLEQSNNINQSQSALDSYAEANFNLTALGGADNNAYIIDPSKMTGFQSWLHQTDPRTGTDNTSWNQPFGN